MDTNYMNFDLNAQTSLPSISVVIISKNNHALLEKALISISNVNYPRSKMQVVVLEETDCPKPFESWIDYHTIPVQHKGFGYARNKALFYAHHSIILFTDDDCTVEPDWIMKLIDALMESPKTMAVSGAVLVPPCGPIGQCENIIGFPGGGVRYIYLSGNKQTYRSTFSTCNCAIKRSAIDAAGGFNESMKFGGEDEQISRHISQNGAIIYQPTAIVYHQPRDSLHGVLIWFIRRGYADVHHARIDQKSTYSIRHFLKNAIGFRITIILLLSIFSGLGPLLFCSVVLIYYCILLWKFRWAYHFYPHLKTMLMIPVVRTVMDIGRDWGIIKGLLRSQKNSSYPGAQ